MNAIQRDIIFLATLNLDKVTAKRSLCRGIGDYYKE
jgi:hypothetical protein